MKHTASVPQLQERKKTLPVKIQNKILSKILRFADGFVRLSSDLE